MDTNTGIVPTNTDALAIRVNYLPTSLVIPDDFTFDEWLSLGHSLQAVAKGWQWWVGDWLYYGEHRWGEKYTQAIEVTGQEYQALADAAWVAGAVESSLRNETLTWNHHRAVAPLDPADQVRFLGESEADDLTVQELRQRIRDWKASKEKQPVDVETDDAKGDGWSVLVGDFRDRLSDKKLKGTVDLILTDPPYPKDDLHLYRDLAAMAVDLLHPRGLLVTYAGSMFIPEVIKNLQDGGLTYGWTFCLLMDEGSRSRIMGRHIMQAWKPLFVFTKGTWPSGAWVNDVVKGGGRDKSLYEWQQDAVAAADIIERLAPIRGRVVDPFLGVGTFGIAALQTGREFIGVEQDEDRAATSIERLKKVTA